MAGATLSPAIHTACMQRLSPLDASFLHLERDVQQLNVGSALIFEGPAPTYDEVFPTNVSRALEKKLEGVLA